MLDQLVESKAKASESRKGFLLTTGFVLTSFLLGAWVFSLFTHSFGMGKDNLEFSTLVAPVSENAPLAPEPDEIPAKQSNQKTDAPMPVRLVNQQSTNESPVKPPDTFSTASNTQESRPNTNFTIDREKISPISSGDTPGRDRTENYVSPVKPPQKINNDDREEPPVIKKPTPTIAPKTATKTLGVINGRATNLVKPPYPPEAKAVHAFGTVNVSVSIDENGNVTSARAVSGHPFLTRAAEAAARKSKFSPTFLNNQPIKVTGVIVYNFVAP